ncbi:hypothetical protein GCM10023185_12520 [Hymenobacter saemangeumensis]|uniref:DUF306 domain-containing protein n=2 Tax=Hymenobacter saemangeumensis TaxID=1084522 RepID=A0ABP8I709_9BACT
MLCRTAVFCSLLGLAASCQLALTEKPAGGTAALATLDKPGVAPLLNTQWALHKLGGQPVGPTKQERFLYLSRNEGRAEGRAGCNQFGGPFTVLAEGELRLGPLGTTRKACPDLQAEGLFLQALNQTQRYRVRGDTLLLLAQEDSLGKEPLAELHALRKSSKKRR